MKKKVGFFCAVLFAISVLCVGVNAEMPESIDELVVQVAEVVPPAGSVAVETGALSVSPDASGDAGETELVTVTSPLPVQVVDTQEASTYSVTGEGWTGDLSTAVKGYFSGIIANNVGCKYVAFRSSQYVYYLFYGQDLTFIDGVFTGQADYVSYSTQSQVFTRGNDSLRLSDAGYHIYTNLDNAYPVLVDGEVVSNEKASNFILVVLLCFAVFSRIFFR